MSNLSPSQKPFITLNQDDLNDGPSSPFHAMDEGEIDSMMVKASPSDFSIPSEKPFVEGILMVDMGDGKKNTTGTQEEEDNEDNDSTISSLKVFQGTADFDYEMKGVLQSKWEFGKTKRGIIKVLYLSIFASFGAFLRIILAQLFGEECKNPGTIGWLKAGQPLCVTADGETSISGGIIFADFPANLLGSFIMGFMQSTDTMDLPKTLPIAWLHENHPFQSYHIIHLAIKTGFCGSLTTFSSWNSEMVMMLLGEDSDRGSLFFRAIFGYFIGVETSIASFVLGKNIARYIFSAVNPVIQKEASETERRKEYGVYINTELSDYERRFLSGFDMAEHDIRIDLEGKEYLQRWKVSTEMCRRHGHHLLPLLTDVEYRTMVLGETLLNDLIVPSIQADWDVEALEKWVKKKKKMDELRNSRALPPRELKLHPAFLSFCALFGMLLFGLIYIESDDAYTMTYRTMIFACFLAPTGALLRWKMSKYNGSIQRYNWFPLGTFGVNVMGCVFSAAMIGLESHFYGSEIFWQTGTIRAVKVGFAGCLSTVSTFVAETSGFLKSKNPLHAYLYVLFSILTSALFGAITFSIFDKEEEGGDDYY